MALDERLVSFSEFKIAESNFPTLPRDQLRTVVEEITASVPLDERVIALDRVLANIDTSQIIPKNVEGVKADPPPIFFSKTPAVLVNIDGEPIWAPIPQNDLKSAVNTNWDLFEHGPTKTYYLRNDRIWLKATDVKGPWEPAGDLPESFKKLPDDDNWKEVKASLPGQKVERQPGAEGVRQPAAGGADPAARRAELPGASRARSRCCGSATPTATSSGWRSPAPSTSSSRAAGSRRRTSPVPGRSRRRRCRHDFKQIPLEHERSRVLASVPGTPQAAEAVLLAQIPQTARVSKTRAGARGRRIRADAPEFQPIEKTTVQRAVNTDKDILKVGDLYYMCFQGVWFMSKAPTGPVGGDRRRAEADLRDSGELAVALRHLRHGARNRTTTPWCSRRRRPSPA